MEQSVKAVVLLWLCLHYCVSAKSFAINNNEEDSSLFDEQSRQLFGDINRLPAWLNRLRNTLPSVLTGRTSTTVSSPTAAAVSPEEVLNWPVTSEAELGAGQITGVAVDENGNPVILHRGEVAWTGSTFDFAGRLTNQAAGPIKNTTVVKLDAGRGSVLERWGDNMFYMPHGLEIDANGNTWVTDVAMHQVFKFPKGSRTPSLTLGEQFVSGSDDTHFCRPTDVAVASSGIFFVADGYCNSRILKFSPEGKVIGTYKGSFNVPHSLALMEKYDALCIADRDNSRLVCINAGLGNGPSFGTPFGRSHGRNIGRVFAIAARDSDIFAVTGASTFRKSEGETVALDELKVLSHWQPSKAFANPHDVVVSRDGESMYVVEIGPNRIVKFALE